MSQTSGKTFNFRNVFHARKSENSKQKIQPANLEQLNVPVPLQLRQLAIGTAN